jgi:hypothetical protein
MASDRDSRDEGYAPPRRSLLALFLQPKVGIPLLIFTAILVAPFIYRESRVSGIPDLGPPFDLEADGTIELAREDNALFDYRAAGTFVRDLPGAENDAYDAVRTKGWSEATDGLKAWVDSNRAALDLWKPATRKTDLLVHQPRELNIHALLPETQSLRVFARVATIEAVRLESEGKFDEAWELHESTLRSSRHSGRHGCLIERLVGMALHSMAVQGIIRWSNDPRVTEQQLATALQAVTEIDAGTAPLSVALKAEYFSLLNTIDLSDPAGAVASGITGGDARLMRLAMFLQNEPLLGRLVLQQIWVNVLEHIDKPLADRPPVQPGRFGVLFEDPAGGYPAESNRLPAATIESLAARSVLVALMVPAITQTAIGVDRERARQAVMIAALAAQIHRRRTGDFPATLKDVVESGVLKTIPVDPFSMSRDPVRYRKDAESLTIWSVGENGTDEGGDVSEVPGRRTTPDVGYVIPTTVPET